MTNGDDGTESVVRAKEIARRALAGELDLLLACRHLADLRDQLPALPDDLMNVFIGVDSEVDGVPLGIERSRWSVEALEAKDVQASDYRERVRQVVTDSLHKLLAELPP